MAKHIRWSDTRKEALTPLLERQYISGSQLTLGRFTLTKGALVPPHSHEHEQFAYVLQGALKFNLENREVIVRTGEVLCIPPNASHGVEALEDTLNLDIFSPSREDWERSEDAYLRK